MKNKKKKRTSSYLLIFLSIVAVILLLIILYLTFSAHSRQRSTQLAQNNPAVSQPLDSDSSETAGFTSGDEDLNNSEQDGFISGDEISAAESSGSKSSNGDTSVQGPSQSTEFHSKGSEASPSETDNSRKAASKAQDNSNGKGTSTAKADTTPEISDDGAISPSHGSSAFDNRSDEKMDTLISQINSQLPTGNGSWSVYICDLAGGSEASINDTPMQAASLIKLFIMGAVYENYDALSQQYGSAALDGYLTPMITVSDNDAANSLVSCLGGGDSTAGMQKVNSFCQAHGYTSTSMGRLLLASNEFGDNYTSAYDCGKFLKEIYQICAGTAQSQSLSHAEDMYALLKQQQRNNKIPAALPEGVSVANKTGELSDVENDAGILYNTQGGNDLVIVFLSQNLTSAGDAQSTIAQLSRSIYLYYND